MKVDEFAMLFLFALLVISCSVFFVAERKLLTGIGEGVEQRWNTVRRKAMAVVAISGLALATIMVVHALNRNNNVPWPADGSTMSTSQ